MAQIFFAGDGSYTTKGSVIRLQARAKEDERSPEYKTWSEETQDPPLERVLGQRRP